MPLFFAHTQSCFQGQYDQNNGSIIFQKWMRCQLVQFDASGCPTLSDQYTLILILFSVTVLLLQHSGQDYTSIPPKSASNTLVCVCEYYQQSACSVFSRVSHTFVLKYSFHFLIKLIYACINNSKENICIMLKYMVLSLLCYRPGNSTFRHSSPRYINIKCNKNY